MMDTNTLFWFFSTIAQVLAGLIAILAAFIVFKINGIEESLKGRSQSIINNWEEVAPNLDDKFVIIDALNSKNFNEICNILKSNKEKAKIEKNRKRLNDYYKSIDEDINKTIPNLKRKAKNTAKWVFSAIGFSILILALMDIFDFFWFRYIIFFIGAFLTGMSLCKIYKVIKNSL